MIKLDVNYNIDSNDIISQIDPELFDYNIDYVDYEKNKKIPKSALEEFARFRVGLIYMFMGKFPSSITDFGYGDGSFLRACENIIETRTGYDIIPSDVPEGCIKSNYDGEKELLTFFDSIEHVHDLSFLENISANNVIISVPWCHFRKLGESWFSSWLHRKPHEHIHHFDEISLLNLMSMYGYTMLRYGNFEDCIRIPATGEFNILTAHFKKL